ncbi:MAG: ABC transporter ATP-binding protein [Betaproteobacteria bacterium]|nr:ABC transporter ATP-binding protein [Betaproteobacteria bacterium]
MKLAIEQLTRRFDGIDALIDVSCTVKAGEILAIAGPNGSGKTTLLDIVTGLTEADRGDIFLGDKRLIGKRPEHIAALGVARSFQIARLFHGLTVLENLIMADATEREGLMSAVLRGEGVAEKRARERAMEHLEYLGMAAYRDTAAAKLSAGQMRRVELGRLLMQERAQLLLLDEPTASLDPEMTQIAVKVIEGLRSKGKAIVLVEHNLDVVHYIADRVMVLDQGRKMADGKPSEVFQDLEIQAIFLGGGGNSHASHR